MPRSRTGLFFGLSCNNSCLFCYSKVDQPGTKDISTTDAKRFLKEKRNAYDELIFTGGEPTIRKDMPELISYAASLGFSLLQLQTNARMFSYPSYAQKVSSLAPIQYFISFHSHLPEISDALTRSPGAHAQTLAGIRNLLALKQHVITNTVVTTLNYQTIPETVSFLSSLNVSSMQLAFLHPPSNAKSDLLPHLSDSAPFIRKAIVLANDAGIPVKVSGVPFCHLPGYEKNILELYLSYNSADSDLANLKSIESSFGRTKSSSCSSCKFDPICQGVWLGYSNTFGLSELKPVEGAPLAIKDLLGAAPSTIIVENRDSGNGESK